MQLILNQFNPWWQSGIIPPNLIGKPRQIFTTLQESLELRQMTIISGVRRVGKTTLMFQLIDYLLRIEKVPPYQILYYSFDEARFDLEELLKFYQIQILQSQLSETEQTFIFLDEIQKLPDWQNKIKIQYDLNPGVKFVLSGSANLVMRQRSRESLAGRFFEYTINPLDFYEFLKFKEIEVDFSREAIFQTEIERQLLAYIKCGGFIEAIPFDEQYLIKYFKESVLERIIFRDIPEVFAIATPNLLLRLLQIFASYPGLYLDYKNLSNDLKIDQRTLSNYVDYLEYTLLIQKLYNYSANRLTSEKKLKRVYLANTSFTHALSEKMEFGKIIEQFWINTVKQQYFYRSLQKDEVDIVHLSENKPLPVEIKMSRSINNKDYQPLLKFLNKFNQKRGLLISLNDELEIEKNNKIIHIFPYWKYDSILQFLLT